MTNQIVIDLGKYADNIGILAGRDRGQAVRRDARLDDADRDGIPVRVVIPDVVYSVNSSFFLGLFEKSVNALGEGEFRRRYVFEGKDADQTREEGIRTALLMGAPFRPLRKKTA